MPAFLNLFLGLRSPLRRTLLNIHSSLPGTALQSIKESLREVGRKQPVLVLSSCETYLHKHKKVRLGWWATGTGYKCMPIRFVLSLFPCLPHCGDRFEMGEKTSKKVLHTNERRQRWGERDGEDISEARRGSTVAA